MRISGTDAIYHKLVYEVRYDQGFIYLDRCGTTANRIMATNAEWILNAESISPQQAPLVNVLTGTQFNFGPLKYDFSLDQPIGNEATITRQDIERFISEVESVSAIVHEELDLRNFVREGFRIWYVFGTESEEKSLQWISKLKALSVGPVVTTAFQGNLESIAYTAVVKTNDRKYRISVNPVERLEQLDLGTPALRQLPRSLPKKQREHLLSQLKAKKRLLLAPQFAVMIDVDAFLEYPIEVAPSDFIRQSLERIEEHLPAALTGGGM